jgi:hypothetical protein
LPQGGVSAQAPRPLRTPRLGGPIP